MVVSPSGLSSSPSRRPSLRSGQAFGLTVSPSPPLRHGRYRFHSSPPRNGKRLIDRAERERAVSLEVQHPITGPTRVQSLELRPELGRQYLPTARAKFVFDRQLELSARIDAQDHGIRLRWIDGILGGGQGDIRREQIHNHENHQEYEHEIDHRRDVDVRSGRGWGMHDCLRKGFSEPALQRWRSFLNGITEPLRLGEG